MRFFILFLAILSLTFDCAYAHDRHSRSYDSLIQSQVCVKIDKAFNNTCKSYDYVYTAPGGATCTEDCVHYDSFGNCDVRNICTYYPGKIGRFTKSVCLKLDAFNKCALWSGG
jgi:hypothetical protein